MNRRERTKGAGGRPSKGPRDVVITRVPKSIRDDVDAVGRAAGSSRQDWLSAAYELGLRNTDELATYLDPSGVGERVEAIARVRPWKVDDMDDAAASLGVTRSEWLAAAMAYGLAHKPGVADLLDQTTLPHFRGDDHERDSRKEGLAQPA